MKFVLICKRNYTNRDLILDRYGRLFHLPVQLKRNGCEGIVVAADYKSKRPETRQMEGLSFYSTPLSMTNPFGFLSGCWHHIKSFKPDIIIASGDSHFGFCGLMMARLLRVPFVFDVYDDYTTFGTNRFPGMKLLFYYAVKKANLVLCASKPLMQQLTQRARALLVVQNGVDTKIFYPRDRNEARSVLGIGDHETVIGYFGSIAKHSGVETLLEATKSICKTPQSVRLLIAGQNDRQIDFKAQNVDYRGVVEQQDLPLYINASDIVVMPYFESPQVNVSNPSKLSEYIACGVPIVATRVSDLPEIFSDIPDALCEAGDAASLKKALAWQLSKRCVIPLSEQNTWEFLGQKMFAALEQLLHAERKA